MVEKIIEWALSGFVGNFTYDRINELLAGPKDPKEQATQQTPPTKDPDIETVNGTNILYKKKYRTFDIEYDLEDVTSLMRQPIVHIVLEDKPTTAWHLGLVVAEDATTSEWYVFRKGRLAFEGTGGGLNQSKALFKKLLEKKIPFTCWVVDQVSSEKLSQGCQPWPRVREQCIPILAFEKNEYFQKYVLGVYKEMANLQQHF